MSRPWTSVVKQAAERWGMTDPSPDDILMAECPAYHEDPEQTARYHRLFEQVCDEVGSRPVPVGMTPIEPVKITDTKVCRCGTVFHRQPYHSRSKWAARAWCSTACYSHHRAIDVERVRQMRAAGMTVREVAERIGVNQKSIYAALSARRMRARSDFGSRDTLREDEDYVAPTDLTPAAWRRAS